MASSSFSKCDARNFSAIVPYVDRSHTTYGAVTSDQLTPDNLSGATASGLGDIKLITSYQGFLPTHNWACNWASSCRRAATAGRTC